jgi:putative ABC transport system permease protein
MAEKKKRSSFRAASRRLLVLEYPHGPFDPVTFAAMAAILLVSAGLASFLPARRATRVDPMIVLRD